MCVCVHIHATNVHADAYHQYFNSDAEFASSIRHLSNRSIRGIFFSGSMLHFLVSSASENTTMKTDYVACCKLLLAQAGGKGKSVHTSAFHHRLLDPNEHCHNRHLICACVRVHPPPPPAPSSRWSALDQQQWLRERNKEGQNVLHHLLSLRASRCAAVRGGLLIDDKFYADSIMMVRAVMNKMRVRVLQIKPLHLYYATILLEI